MSKRPSRSRTRRVLAVLVAAVVVTAACSSEPGENAVDDPVPDTAEPTATTSTGDAEPDLDEPVTTDPGADDSAPAPAEPGDAEPSEQAPSGDEPDAAVTAASLRSFGECGEVLEYIRTNATATIGPWGLGDAFGGELLEEGAIMVDEAAGGDFAAPQPGVDYSTSNVQELGIDEPDVAKTDGRRIVAAVQNRIQIVDVTGPEPVLMSTLELGEQWGHRLLLHGDRVLVFSTRWDTVFMLESGGEAMPLHPEPGWGPMTEVIEIDLSGPAPAVVRRLDIEGHYVSARMTDGVVRLVTSSRPTAIPWAVPSTAGFAAQERATATNRELIADTTIDHWLPRFVVSDAEGLTIAGGRLVGCGSVWAPAHYSGPGTLSVTTIDIESDGLAGPMDTSSILADGSTVYASRDHLYVSTTEWIDWRVQPADLDGDTIAETEIHVFDTAEPFSSPYVGSASVPGTVLNQYSMSEHEGHLRVATTTAPPWQPWRVEEGGESESLVTVFAVGVDGLTEVGQVGGLGIGERIFAVRYLGDIAAVVTFREVDPLYLIDLSDPGAPEVRGELKITGYSAYLHPLGDDVLLGVGQDATDEGFTVGTQVSLFDIADLDRPVRIAQWSAPGAHSQVEFDALSFLYWPPLDLAVLPMVQYPTDERDAEPPFLGAVALTAVRGDLSERARFSHAAPPLRKCRESREIIVRPDGSEERGPFERYCWYDSDYEAQIIASTVVGDRLYLASSKALESISLGSMQRVSLLPWSR